MTAAKPPTRSEVRIALGLAATLLFAVVLLTAALGGVRRSDFTGYYMGGLIIRQGNAPRLYDLGEQARIQRQLFNREDLLINPHPLMRRCGLLRSPDSHTLKRMFSGARSTCCSGCYFSIFFGITRQSPEILITTSGSAPCLSHYGLH